MNKIFRKRRVISVGLNERVTFPGLNIDTAVRAKIDTGAFSGALHATQIKEVEAVNGQRLLEFWPLASAPVRLGDYEKRRVRSSNGQVEERYFIKTEVAINGVVYPIEISLADRSQLKFPVLIGRKFLQKHKFLIDLGSESE